MNVTSNYREVMGKLAHFEPELRRQLTKDMRALSVEVVTEARMKASWSATIPSAIRPTATATAVGVRVSARVPIAVLNERRKAWKHPVFGNTDVWVSQTPRPSVRPVVDAQRAQLQKTGDRIVKAAQRRAGL